VEGAGTCAAHFVDDRMQTACVGGDSCCAPGCTPATDSDCVEPNRMFVTSTTYTGNIGGLAGADASCQARARAANLPGTFLAFLSSAAGGPAFRRLGNASGWVRTDGKPFGNTVDDLRAGRILYPPRVDELGKELTELRPAVATGTTPDGVVDTRTCNNWGPVDGSSQQTGGYADAGADYWFSSYFGGCDLQFRLYCFETARKATLIVVPPASARLAFVTDGVLDMTMGLEGADRLCKTEASAAGLEGSWKALLATSTASALSRFDLAGPPWVRTDGVPIVASARDLLTAGKPLIAALVRGARPGTVVDTTAATGGTTPDAVGKGTCRDWTSAAGTTVGFVGIPQDTSAYWFYYLPDPASKCSSFLNVYCLQE
jgi:hypothetical protein